MSGAAITQYFDVAQVLLYVFWIFFAGLIWYLHRENKREGYPLEVESGSGRLRAEGWPATPGLKFFRLRDGRMRQVPREGVDGPSPRSPSMAYPGTPVVPQGDRMHAGVGPGAWSQRVDEPETSLDGDPRLAPLRAYPEYDVHGNDPDPRGLPVIAGDGMVAGVIVDLWVDRSEALFRYLEMDVTLAAGGTRRALIPQNFAVVTRRHVRVRALYARHFADVPVTKHPDRVTLLEEDVIQAWYGGGTLYADRAREEPLL